jgi:hypothetical protein
MLPNKVNSAINLLKPPKVSSGKSLHKSQWNQEIRAFQNPQNTHERALS